MPDKAASQPMSGIADTCAVASDQWIGESSVSAIFGTNLQRIREERGWAPTCLAARLGMTVAELARIEAGAPRQVTYKLIIKVIAELDTSYDDLMDGIG